MGAAGRHLRDGSDLQVVVALPGARAEEVVVQITPTGLQIENHRTAASLSAQVNVVRLEIPYGRMRRRIDLPPDAMR